MAVTDCGRAQTPRPGWWLKTRTPRRLRKARSEDPHASGTERLAQSLWRNGITVMSSIHRRHSRCPQVMRGRASGIRTLSYLVQSTVAHRVRYLLAVLPGRQSGRYCTAWLSQNLRQRPGNQVRNVLNSRLISFIHWSTRRGSSYQAPDIIIYAYSQTSSQPFQ
ncbi:hypothetical protein BO86DRAFT_153275 [Aspergillus japonicus CBS 114.51]|uniref:Uncharacterized protein n=1 Tax=Aspergillus japonicus CBS 114.51 TaxID=1448312 RepID=A0A8T8WU36_ASPJA|nr:hypothetical protein BO86DRAFT_153275 [Aspergillus japonicus CBS 114.51]RAH79368.1 hypothetical protein BO86DRAFT_153275 [Aspergillus japonicus CBS 114.51]